MILNKCRFKNLTNINRPIIIATSIEAIDVKTQ